ncbi:MAG: DUF2206 domain-containing protein [Candidatus Bathyarchaeia archaeon]|jgi:uncharacterized membrane protein
MQKKTFLSFASSKHFVAFIIFQAATWFAVGLNIPVLRQVLGFFFLSFVPGLVILKALRINQKSLTYTFLFSVGLSLAFVMFIGLLLNWILPLMGLSAPLNTFNLVTTVTILEFILVLAIELNPSPGSLFIMPKFVVSKSLLLIVSIPLFSILGAILVDYYANNYLLLFTFFLICILFLLSTFGKISSRLYPLVILAIAIALLFQSTLANHYLNGWDIHLEYYLAQVTKSNQYWNSSLMSSLSASTNNLSLNNFNAMLSVTILPTIYSNVLNLDIFYVYTIIYPLLFSLVPVALFLLYQKQIGSRFAFWSVFLFVSFAAFYVDLVYLARQMIAELFFVLIFLLLFEHETNRNSRSVQLILIGFAFATVVSHYSTAFMCIFFLLFFSLGLIKEAKASSRILYLSLFAFIDFSWIILVSNSTPITSLVTDLKLIISSFQDLVVSESNNQVLSFAARTFSTASIVNEISRFVFILINIIIAIGFLKTFFARKDVNLSKGFFAVSVAGALLILGAVVVPNFAVGLTINRIYQFGLFFAAPFLFIGIEFICRVAIKLKRLIIKTTPAVLPRASVNLGSILISALLITSFLFQTGVINNLAGGIPTSISLTIDKGQFVRMGNLAGFDAFTFAGDVYGARWLSNHITTGSTIYSDYVSAAQVLASYGLINPGDISVLSNYTLLRASSLIYLRNLNVEFGLFEEYQSVHNITEYSQAFENADLVYSNGQSEIFYVPSAKNA